MTAKKNAAEEAPVKESLFARLEREAMEDYEPRRPYVIDDVEPPIVITDPVEAERLVALAELFAATREQRQIEPARFHPLLKAICGDAYDRVWEELLRKKHLRVAYAFLDDVQSWFAPNGPASAKGGASELPGGSEIS